MIGHGGAAGKEIALNTQVDKDDKMQRVGSFAYVNEGVGSIGVKSTD